MKNTCKISIIVPCYNAEKYIKPCLKRLLIADDDVEIIVINDGSTDGTKRICESIIDHRVRLLNTKNGGVSAARNAGMKLAKGEYIMFVDSDDYMMENWMEIVRPVIASRERYDVIVVGSHIGWDAGTKDDLVKKLFVQQENGAKYYRLVTSKIYRRQFLSTNNISFDEKLINGEDMLFNLKVFSNVKRFFENNNSIYKYRIAPGSSTHKYDNRIIANQAQIVKVLEEDEFASNYSGSYYKESVRMILTRLSYEKYHSVKKEYGKLAAMMRKNRRNNSNIYNLILLFLEFRMYFVLYLVLRMKRGTTIEKMVDV